MYEGVRGDMSPSLLTQFTQTVSRCFQVSRCDAYVTLASFKLKNYCHLAMMLFQSLTKMPNASTLRSHDQLVMVRQLTGCSIIIIIFFYCGVHPIQVVTQGRGFDTDYVDMCRI